MSENVVAMMTITLKSGTQVHIEPCCIYGDHYEVYRIRSGQKFLNFEGQMVEFTGENQQEHQMEPPAFEDRANIMCFNHIGEALEWVVDPFELVDKSIASWDRHSNIASDYLKCENRTEVLDTAAHAMIAKAARRIAELEQLKVTGLR